MTFLTKIFGDPNAKVIKSLEPLVSQINALEPELEKLDLPALRAKTAEFKKQLAEGKTLDDILPEAFAVVREVSRRVTGMRHFDVQLLGGLVLHHGQIAEMKTGEGKTLVGTLPIYLNALSGKGVHVVTVNDYLAKRDAVWMGQIYDALGLSVGIIQQLLVSYRYNSTARVVEEDLSEGSPVDAERDAKGAFKVEYEYLESCSRQEAYACDITYGTNNEFGFDYLRDNMVQNLADMSQRGLNFAIVDEVDSILIDEARTPLIISAPAEEAQDLYYKFADLVRRLKPEDDFNVDEKMRAASLTERGIKKMEDWLGIENIYAEGGIGTVHHVEQALRAYALFKRDRDYVVENDEVIIVDEFTGRKMMGRRYSEGLHQAIEAQEGVKIQRESRTLATVTFQNYFRLYKKLAGMTGTAVTEAEEFGKIYNLEVVVVPTNKVNCRHDLPDRIYRTEEAKYQAIAKAVKELQQKGQPVLIGTISVEKNEELSIFLQQEGVKHEILNAKNHEREGEIVAQAGAPGAVTLATNMAGRGVDIILGGNPPDVSAKERCTQIGGLFVVGTERHESRRIDNQLRGRSGRQGDPGATQFYLSTEDDLMRIFAGERIRSVMKSLRVPDDMPIENKSISKIIESAQKKVEGFHFDSRKHLLEYDDVLNRHREVIYNKRREVLEVFEQEKNALTENLQGEEQQSLDNKTLRGIIFEMVEDEIEQVVSFHTNSEEKREWNMEEIKAAVLTIFPLTDPERDVLLHMNNGGTEKLQAVEARTKIIEFLSELAKKKYQDMLVAAVPEPGIILEVEKQILLRSMDNLWVEHLVAVDYLRTGISLRGYGQRDPLVEYKKETYRMFNELLNLISRDVVYTIYKVSVGLKLAPSLMSKGNMILSGAERESAVIKSVPKDAEGNKVGRNDPCPCGSGKKFKKCHGSN
ncbi:MAG: preprotein translocase subunit SecA [Candidatus Magasanikbacteria bacterium RIFOXYD2_FULL_41_14]|uniref:Protein translocase subunit SecA n=1 Tax=Candidatus Magasanikbacteria bacterium RIFOXYD2_FULL_41_14 TaxID=1798709 RepID=A0A1F6PDZ1_9BACT|nr:MAG: preprotein translocase subunit SecA [Candidatus Magasanikbacteria bacterium RIFOXYD2_FULL_41_14]